MMVPFDGPLDLQHTLGCGQAFRWSFRDGWYLGTAGATALKVRSVPGGLDVRSNPRVGAAFVRSYFRLDDDLDGILEGISVDRHARRAAELYRGLRLLRQDPWECLVSFVASAASNIPKISRCVEKLSRSRGRRLELDGWETFSFPSPRALAGAGERGLRACELGFRARRILALARRAAGGAFDPAALRALPRERAREALLSLDGVGPKVADCVLLFSLDRLEAFPVDRWVRRAVERLFFRGRRLTERRVREWGREHYGRHAGYAQQYLFHYIRHGEGSRVPGCKGAREQGSKGPITESVEELGKIFRDRSSIRRPWHPCTLAPLHPRALAPSSLTRGAEKKWTAGDRRFWTLPGEAEIPRLVGGGKEGTRPPASPSAPTPG